MEHTDSKPSKTIKLADYVLSIDELEEKQELISFPILMITWKMHLKPLTQQKPGLG